MTVEAVDVGEEEVWPAEGPIFIQWKGTEVCLDFTCPDCGEWWHFDGMFAYALRCDCGSLWQLPSHLEVRKVTPESWADRVQIDLGEQGHK